MSQWQPYPNVPWVLYAPCGCAKGGFFIRNSQTGQEFHTPTEDGIHQYVADVSGQSSRFRLGDAIHGLTKSVGISRCTKCAKRQTFLNRLFG